MRPIFVEIWIELNAGMETGGTFYSQMLFDQLSPMRSTWHVIGKWVFGEIIKCTQIEFILFVEQCLREYGISVSTAWGRYKLPDYERGSIHSAFWFFIFLLDSWSSPYRAICPSPWSGSKPENSNTQSTMLFFSLFVYIFEWSDCFNILKQIDTYEGMVCYLIFEVRINVQVCIVCSPEHTTIDSFSNFVRDIAHRLCVMPANAWNYNIAMAPPRLNVIIQ